MSGNAPQQDVREDGMDPDEVGRVYSGAAKDNFHLVGELAEGGCGDMGYLTSIHEGDACEGRGILLDNGYGSVSGCPVDYTVQHYQFAVEAVECAQSYVTMSLQFGDGEMALVIPLAECLEKRYLEERSVISMLAYQFLL